MGYNSRRDEEMDQNTKMDRAFEEMFTSSMGFKGLTNRLKNKAILKGYHYLKNHFGFEHSTNNFSIFKEIVQYFETHTNVTIIPETKYNLNNTISIDKVFMMDKQTFVYISWDDKATDRSNGYFYIFGKNSYHHFSYIYDNIIDVDNKSGICTTIIYTIYASSNSDDWQGIRKSTPSRPFDTLYFDNDIEEKIKAHIDNWMKNKETYRSRGITFKTGILLYGSPGTGKSSIAAAVADYMDCNIIMIDSATFKDLNLNEVTASINADDRMYVVLLDDIDVILTDREDDKATTDDKANISKLLGFLDSSNSPDNVIFIATTNHIELFDSAIRRAGRFDKVIEVENIHKSQGTPMRMCKGFGLSEEDGKKVIDSYNQDAINPADLQVKILDTIKSNMINEENTEEE